jgi:hypothetical protein
MLKFIDRSVNSAPAHCAKYLAVPARPRPAFMVIQAEFFFELLAAVPYPVPFRIAAPKINSRKLFWNDGEKSRI